MIAPNPSRPAKAGVPPRPRVLAIDPGSTASGVVVYDADIPSGPVVYAAKVDNVSLLAGLSRRILTHGPQDLYLTGPHVLVVEFPVPRGMPASRDLFLAVEWIGRFREAWGMDAAFVKMDRKDVKMSLCGVSSAKDTNIRAAIIDRFGGKDRAIGRKATAGPLYGVKADAWQALAVAMTYMDRPATGKEVGRE